MANKNKKLKLKIIKIYTNYMSLNVLLDITQQLESYHFDLHIFMNKIKTIFLCLMSKFTRL